jgi:hypothetical protein
VISPIVRVTVIVWIILLFSLFGCISPTAPLTSPILDGTWTGSYRVTRCVADTGGGLVSICTHDGLEFPFTLDLKQDAQTVSGQMKLASTWGPIYPAIIRADQTRLVGVVSLMGTRVHAVWDVTPTGDAIGGTLILAYPRAHLTATLIGARQ